jgi:hypothetical protein
VRRVGGEVHALCGFPRGPYLDEVTLLAHPAHEVAEVRAIGARAMDDEDEVLAGLHVG